MGSFFAKPFLAKITNPNCKHIKDLKTLAYKEAG